jgi:carbon-monoxide dehydrogenase medium subunit
LKEGRIFSMKPSRFRYFAAQSVEEAAQLLAEHGDEARVLAGGQSLVPLMNMRLARPGVLIDLNSVAELSYIRSWDGGLAIGAMTRDAMLEHDATAAARLPLLVEAVHCVGHPAIRNRGTVGGSIAHADPAAELPSVLLALDAQFLVCNAVNGRIIAAKDFFLGYRSTSLKPGEILTEVRIPGLPSRAGSAFVEFARRKGGSALAGVGAVLALDEDGTIAQARLGLCGVGPSPVRASAAEIALRGRYPSNELWSTAAASVVSALHEPPSDIHGSADYRRHLAAVLTQRALALAAERAERNR